METVSVDLDKTGIRNPLLSDYLAGNSRLDPFYSWKPSMESFPELIKARTEKKINRIVLAEELQNQHLGFYERYPVLKNQVELIRKENTFTVTTGHQLCFATGPLYFIYKIISTINLAKELKKRFPENNFIPVYWMASEDHDFEEVNHIHLFGKQLKWEQPVKGVTGKIPTNTTKGILEEIKQISGETEISRKLEKILDQAYLQNQTLAEATRELVLQLFAESGLLVLDADCHSLKTLFKVILKSELTEQNSFSLVSETNKSLEEFYELPIKPRPLNLFYLDNGLRERIVKTPAGNFEIVNTDLSFTSAFLLDLLEKQPERFSPNVVLRPVYQESILPNLAYIGGPGEIAYWLQLKSVFDFYGIFYPVLVPRNHAVILNKKQYDKFTALGFANEDLFQSADELINRYIKSLNDVPSSLLEEREELSELYSGIIQKLTSVDPTLQGASQAEMQRALNGIETIEKKLQAALKRRNETAINQIRNTLEKVKPANQLQERYLNFIPFYLKFQEGFIAELTEKFKPFDSKLQLFIEQES